MVAAVGALGRACAGEHADRIFAGAAVGVDAAGVGVAAGQVFLAEEGEQLAPGLVGGGGDLGDLLVAEGFAVVVDLDLLAAEFVGGVVVGYGFEAGWPVAEELEVFRGEGLEGVVVALAEGGAGAGGGGVVGFPVQGRGVARTGIWRCGRRARGSVGGCGIRCSCRPCSACRGLLMRWCRLLWI